MRNWLLKCEKMVVRNESLRTASQPAPAAQAHALVRDLHTPRPEIFWTDLTATAVVAWSAFAGALIFPFESWPMMACLAIAVFAFYRGLCFVHEISHIRTGALRSFEEVWNWLFGMPMLIPSFAYCGVHQHHHNLATYGTPDDPEYLPFGGKPLMWMAFIVESILLPIAFVIRFFVVAPIGMVSTAAHRWICRHASSLCINVKFRRNVPEEARREIRRRELLTIALWIAAAFVAVRLHSAARTLLTWYLTVAAVSLINTLRTLGAHRYRSDGTPLDRDAQLSDSIDTPGAFWTELWAPVGLRYHALHHYFPGIPYHNLAEARSRLIENLPDEALYRSAFSPSLPHSLDALARAEKPH